MITARAASSLRHSARSFTARAAPAVLLLLPWAAVSGQQPEPPLQAGTRVRLTAPCPAAAADCRLEGRLARIGVDTITITVSGSPVHRSLSTIRRVELSLGRRSYRLVGAGVGFLVGAGVTYAVLNSGGSTALCDRSANQDAIGSGECLGLTAIGGVVGAGVGALVGGIIKAERWENVPLERLRVSSWPPAGRAVGLTLTLSF